MVILGVRDICIVYKTQKWKTRQRTPVGNKQGDRRSAPSLERRCLRLIILRAPARSISLMVYVWWADATLNIQARRSDGNAAIEFVRKFGIR